MKISRFVPAAAVVIGRVAATGSDTTPAGILPRAADATDCPCLVALFEPSAACGKVNCTIITGETPKDAHCYCNPPGDAVGTCNKGQYDCRLRDRTCAASLFSTPCYISPNYDRSRPPPGQQCDNYYWPCPDRGTGSSTPATTTGDGNGQADATAAAGLGGTGGQKNSGSESRSASLRRALDFSVVLAVAATLENLGYAHLAG